MMIEDSAPPPISVSCATKFHADYLAHNLWQSGRLAKAISAHTYRRFTSRVELPYEKYHATLPYVYASVAVAKLNGHRLNYLNNWVEEAAIHLFDRGAAKLMKDRQALVCWSRSSLLQMQRNRSRGGLNIIERVGSDTRFQHQIISQECERLGLSKPQLPTSFVLDREDAEYACTDAVLCPSNHVIQSLGDKPGLRLVLNRYGVNSNRFHGPSEMSQSSDVFEVLYVGTLGVRKGCAYLLETARHFHANTKVRFKLIGPLEPAFEPIFRKYQSYVDWLGPVPNSQLAEHYRNASVFLFPSLDEGMAYVQIEAMACGLPLIATKNAGADALICDGINGFLVESHNSDVLIERVQQLIDSPELLQHMKSEVRKPLSSYTWADHAQGVVQCIDSLRRA